MGDPQSIRPLRASLPSIWSVISLWFGGRSRFAGSSQLGALAVLIVTLVATDWCVVQSVRARPLVHGNRIGVDLADGVLYQSVAGRVRRGEGYYSVAAVELGSRGYQARSVFNWRLPAYAWAFGSVGPAVAYAVLAALLALVGVSSTILFEGPSKCLVPLGMLCVRLACAPLPALLSRGLVGAVDLLCGSSGCVTACAARCYSCLPSPSVSRAGDAVCCSRVGVALGRREWKEVTVWMVVVVGFVACFILHYHCVCQISPVGTNLDFTMWLQHGGTAFVVSTCRMSFILSMLPVPVAAVYLPLSVIGLIGASSSRLATGLLATVIAYLLLFSIAGNGPNYYWGWMIVPPLWVGFCLALLAM